MTLLNLPKKELKGLALFFVLLVIILKFVFYKQDLLTLIKAVFSFYWILILPGYAIMLFWKERVSFSLRLLIGSGFSTALIGALSYHLGLVGINLNVQIYFLPLIIMLLGLYLYNEHTKTRV